MTKDDKFILMGMDDAGDIADVLKNKTAKKLKKLVESYQVTR